MAHFGEPIAYIHDGAIYCPDCAGDLADDDRDDVGVALIGQGDDEMIGQTCDVCHACYANDGTGEDWIADAATSCRWSRCASCNSQTPWPKDDRDVRLAARRGVLRCTSCARPDVHF